MLRIFQIIIIVLTNYLNYKLYNALSSTDLVIISMDLCTFVLTIVFVYAIIKEKVNEGR